MLKTIILLSTTLLLSACGDKFVRDTDGALYRVVEKCDPILNPKYGKTDTSDLLIGAGVGGVIGKKLGKGSNRAAIAGATLGAIIASEHKYLYTNCREEYRIVNPSN